MWNSYSAFLTRIQWVNGWRWYICKIPCYWICQLANWIWQHLSGFRTPRSLKRTWRSVAAPVREGMASPLHYSPTSSHSAFSTAPCNTPITWATAPHRKHSANTCVCTFFPRLLPAKRLVQEGKVFDSFFLEMTACRISLDSWWWSFFPPTPSFPSTPLWTALTCISCHLCGVSGRAALVRQSDWSAFPRLHPTEPGHHENLEAAEELCLSDLRSPRLVSDHGNRKCWQHGLQCTGGWVGNITVKMSVISQVAHFHVVLQMLSHSLINWTWFLECLDWISLMFNQDTYSVSSSVFMVEFPCCSLQKLKYVNGLI